MNLRQINELWNEYKEKYETGITVTIKMKTRIQMQNVLAVKKL